MVLSCCGTARPGCRITPCELSLDRFGWIRALQWFSANRDISECRDTYNCEFCEERSNEDSLGIENKPADLSKEIYSLSASSPLFR